MLQELSKCKVMLEEGGRKEEGGKREEEEENQREKGRVVEQMSEGSQEGEGRDREGRRVGNIA